MNNKNITVRSGGASFLELMTLMFLGLDMAGFVEISTFMIILPMIVQVVASFLLAGLYIKGND